MQPGFFDGNAQRKSAGRNSRGASAPNSTSKPHKATGLATLNALAVGRQHLGSLDKVKRMVPA